MSRYRLRHLLVVTTGLTFVLMLLGIFTAGSGTGLSCQAQWPTCDGGLFPRSLASVPEWSHRFVAMITGFFILGSAAGTWLGDATRETRVAATAAVVLLPLQIVLGALTVTLNGLFPGGFSMPVQVAHFLTATTIFSLLVVATVWTWRPDPGVAVRRAVLAAVALYPLSIVLSRGAVFLYSPGSQAAYYGVSLALFAAALTVALLGRERFMRRTAVAALCLLLAQFLIGRGLVPFTTPVQWVYYGLLVVTNAPLVALVWRIVDAPEGGAPARSRAD